MTTKKTIDNSKFKEPTPENPETFERNVFARKSLGYYKISSDHGKSMGKTECPFCGCWNYIYIWSFSGGGKLCENCRVHLNHFRTIADPAKFKFPHKENSSLPKL